MSVQDVTSAVTVPRQAGPAESPLAPPSPPVAPAPLIGRDRPLTTDERQFIFGLVGIFVFIEIFIVAFLIIAENVWS